MNLNVAGPDADELLVVSIIRHPGWCDLAPVPGAFPGELCAFVAVSCRFFTRPRQVVPAIHQHVTGQRRLGESEQGQHENLSIPKGMMSVAESAQRLSADAGTICPPRCRNQQLEDVET